MVTHLFTQVLPIPLPEEDEKCFWRQDILQETQGALLHSLSLIARHFAAACCALRATRSFDASRTVTFAAIAAVSDVVLRAIATDKPSEVSLHYSGYANGPVLPFGFDIGDFAVESENLTMIDPYLAIARVQILEYFHSIKEKVVDDHMNLVLISKRTDLQVRVEEQELPCLGVDRH